MPPPRRATALFAVLVVFVYLRYKSATKYIRRQQAQRTEESAAKLGIEPAAIIPLDEEIGEYDLKFKPLLELPDTSKAVQAVNDLMTKLLKTEEVQIKGGKDDSTTN